MENTLFEIIDFSDTRVIIKVTALNALDVAFHPFLDSKMAYISVQRGAQPTFSVINHDGHVTTRFTLTTDDRHVEPVERELASAVKISPLRSQFLLINVRIRYLNPFDQLSIKTPSYLIRLYYTLKTIRTSHLISKLNSIGNNTSTQNYPNLPTKKDSLPAHLIFWVSDNESFKRHLP